MDYLSYSIVHEWTKEMAFMCFNQSRIEDTHTEARVKHCGTLLVYSIYVHAQRAVEMCHNKIAIQVQSHDNTFHYCKKQNPHTISCICHRSLHTTNWGVFYSVSAGIIDIARDPIIDHSAHNSLSTQTRKIIQFKGTWAYLSWLTRKFSRHLTSAVSFVNYMIKREATLFYGHWYRHTSRHNPEVQYAFKISMTHWILQFALRIAVRSVLHRCASLDIHCLKLLSSKTRNFRSQSIISNKVRVWKGVA